MSLYCYFRNFPKVPSFKDVSNIQRKSVSTFKERLNISDYVFCYFRNFPSAFFSQDMKRNHLGRWRTIKTNQEKYKFSDLANADNCYHDYNSNKFERKTIKYDRKKKNKKQVKKQDVEDVSIPITCYNDVEDYHGKPNQQKKEIKKNTKKDRLKKQEQEEQLEFLSNYYCL